jgi:hypothetical protein
VEPGERQVIPVQELGKGVTAHAAAELINGGGLSPRLCGCGTRWYPLRPGEVIAA